MRGAVGDIAGATWEFAATMTGFWWASLALFMAGVTAGRIANKTAYLAEGAETGRVAPTSPDDPTHQAAAHNHALGRAEASASWSGTFEAIAALGVGGMVVVIGVVTAAAVVTALERVLF